MRNSVIARGMMNDDGGGGGCVMMQNNDTEDIYEHGTLGGGK